MKKLLKNFFLTLSIFALPFSSCSKDEEVVTQNAPVASTDVYISGSTRDSNNDQIPTIWKNGVPSILPSTSGIQTIAEKIAVSGNDVYAINSNFNELGNILLWKNGILVQTIPNNLPVDLKVDNNDVYILGRSGNVFKYWKNGNEILLTNNLSNNFVSNMIIANGDVYIAGSENSGTKNVAKLWKNGIATTLSNPNLDTFVNGLDVSGTDVVVLLREKSLSNTMSLKVSKNASITTLESNVFNDFSIGVGSIKIVLGAVFVTAKIDLDATHSKIVFWKNTDKINITSGTTNALPFDMEISGNDVHILGAEKNPGSSGRLVLKHWINGQPVVLTTDAEGNIPIGLASMTISKNGDSHITVLHKYFKNNASAVLLGSSPATFGIVTTD